jgi:hypothetical protein
VIVVEYNAQSSFGGPMKKAFLLILVVAVLASLASCDLLRAILGGYTVSGTVSFSSFTRSVGGELRIQLFSTIDASGGAVADLAPRAYSGEEQVSYAFAGVKPGDYRVQAFIDRNATDVWEEGEPFGGYPSDADSQPVLTNVKRDTVMDLTVWANPIPITIVYRSGMDDSIADAVEALLESTLTAAAGVSGAMPLFAVTKISDTDIPSIWDSAYALAGTPIIITPCIAAVSDRSRNIAQAGHGIIAMGLGGAQFLDLVKANWGIWGFTGQSPADIGMGHSFGGSSFEVKTRGTSSGAWSSPLRSAALSAVDGSVVPLAAAAIPTYEVDIAGGVDPVGGTLLAESTIPTDRYPIVRQGRFVQYGFQQLADLPDTGAVLFVNLVKMMSAY